MAKIERQVLAIDPGAATGIAMYEEGQFKSEEISGFRDTAIYLEHLVRFGKFTDLVIENFTITAKTARLTRQDDAMQLIGVCEGLADKYRMRFIKQQAAKRKRVTDQMLKNVGVYQRTKDGHANDAAKHLIAYGVAWSLFPENIMRRLITGNS